LTLRGKINDGGKVRAKVRVRGRVRGRARVRVRVRSKVRGNFMSRSEAYMHINDTKKWFTRAQIVDSAVRAVE